MSNQRKWSNNTNYNKNSGGYQYGSDSPFSSYSSTSTSPIMGRSNDNINSSIGNNNNNKINMGSSISTPQIGSFTQNYELFSMNKIFSINSAQQQIDQQQQSQDRKYDTSNQFINNSNNNNNSSNGLKRSNPSLSKSLSDHFISSQQSRDEHHFNKYGVLPQNSPYYQQQQQQLQQPTSILLLAQGGSDEHTFTAMYCSNDYLIFRYVGQTKVPFYKWLKWDKDPAKKIVSMCFDPTAIWLLCLLNDTSCKVIPIYYDMCKKVGFIDDNNSGNSRSSGNQVQQPRPSTTDKTDRLSNWVSTTRLFKSSNVNKEKERESSQSNLNNLTSTNSTSGGSSNSSGYTNGLSKFKIPQLTKKTAMGSNCLWWKTSNSVDYAIITTTSNNIYFVNLVDNSVYKHRFEHSIEKIEMVQSDSETFLLIATKSNGYFQLLIEQKIDHHRYETIIQLGNQSQSVSSIGGNSSRNGHDSNLLSRSSDFNIKTLFQTDRIPSDRVLLVQKTNIINNSDNVSPSSSTSPQPIGSGSMFINNNNVSSSNFNNFYNNNNNYSSNNNNENLVVSFLKSTSKLEIYEPLYLNKYPLFVYQLPPNTTNFFFTKHITIVSEIVTTLAPGSNEAIQRSNVSVLSNLVAGTASNSRYINNQSIMQTFQLAPGEVILGISKSLNHQSNNNNNFIINSNSSYYQSMLLQQQQQQQQFGISDSFEESMKYTRLPTVSLWTNFAIYELRQKRSPEEIFFELVSCNLEKSDGEALGKTFGMDLLSCYETAADIKFDQGQYGRALDLYYLSGVRTNKLVFKFLEIGRMDIIMTHLKAILHQPDAFNVLDRKKISDILFQCYLQKLLTSRKEFKSMDTEFQHFLSTNQDYDVFNCLSLLSKNGLLDYFFSVAHSRKIMPVALQMLIDADILHLDSQNISFLQSAYSLELKSHSGGMIFDCLPPKLQVKLIIDDQHSIPRYLRRIYHILSLLEEKELLDIAETFDPLLFTPPGQLNPKLSKTNPAISQLYQIKQQHQLQQQQHLNIYHNNNNINNSNINNNINDNNQIQYQNQIDDHEFGENNSIPGRQSESIPIRDEEYFELYIITLLTLIYHRRQKHGHHHSHHSHHHRSHHHHHHHRHHRHNNEIDKDEINNEQKDIPDNESDISTTTNTTTNTEDSEDDIHSKSIKLKPDPELLICPMPPLKNEKRAIKVSCGWDHVALISESGELFTWGKNQSGQLGHGLEIGKIQTTPKRLEFFRGKSPVIMVECGGEHTICVDSDYIVYSWGQDKFGQLGHGTKSVSQNRPKVIEEISGQKIQAIAAGFAHTIVLKKSGELYSFGYGDQGQLGHGSFVSKSIPTRIELNTIVGIQHGGGKITQIACGFGHSVICSDNGEVYSWGLGKQGQLGHGNYESIARPRLIEALKGVTKISCGHFYTMATTDLKNVYSWGLGEHMKLGHGSDKNEATPRVVDFFIQKNVSKIVCGLNHTITLTYPGDLNNNSLSNDDVEDFIDLGPSPPPASSSNDNNNGNSRGGRLGLNENSQISPIYACGAGEHGKLGLGGDLKSPFFDKPIPTAIKGVNALNLIDISCGTDFTAMITSNGALYVWGYGNFGQIGNGKTDDAWVPIRIPLTDSKTNQSSLQSDNKKQRYSQEGLEDILRSNVHSYRPFHILSKAKQFENYDIAAVIYDILGDSISTLEYRLLSLEKKNFEKDKELFVLFSLLSNYFIKDYEYIHKQRQLQLQQLPSFVSSSTTPTLNSNSSTPSSGTTPPLNSSTPPLNSPQKPIQKLSSSENLDLLQSSGNLNNSTIIVNKEEEKLLKYNLISMFFNYYKKKNLPINELENFLITNIDYFSELLSNVIQINCNSELPLILNFSPIFYISTLKNYLQSMKNQSELEKKLQKVSDKILWQNIKENLEKNLLQRSKIEIPTLNQDIYSSFTASKNTPLIGEKDIAFTCNHFFSKRNFFGSTLPDFQSELQKLSIPSSQTLQYITQEFNKKSISQSCPVCLFNSIRDIQNHDETKKDILKLFKLS
ncbi:hypothetical protein RB653_001556 [Dictyostelium firmibasis]|uniref:RCC1-like domain-containing protein n=1 Tax=Dictyostelium firmibasis TaxID=79012 RepID=A0AAN7YVF3_9MYCE